MLIRPGQFSTRDLSQRYNRTYCWLRVGDVKRLVKIHGINDDGIVFINADGTWKLTHDYMNDPANNVFIELLPVNRGWVTTPVGVYHQRRIPAHQFSRGICDENCSIVSISMQPKIVSYGLVAALYGEHTITPKESFTAFMEDKSDGCVLSGAFAFGKSGAVWCHRIAIGNIRLHREEMSDMLLAVAIQLKSQAAMFFQELTDIIRRNELPNLTVRVNT